MGSYRDTMPSNWFIWKIQISMDRHIADIGLTEGNKGNNITNYGLKERCWIENVIFR